MSGQITVGQAGERGVIEAIAPYLAHASVQLLVAAGDDCAVSTVPQDGDLQVLTSDLLVENTHFLRKTGTDWLALGRRAMVSNLSDLAAMGALPSCALVSIGLPPDFLLADLVQVYEGLQMESNTWGGVIAGGDTVRADHVVINVALIGWKSNAHAPCRRSDSRPGQNVYVSGALGGCRAGLSLQLDAELQSVATCEFARALIARQQLPQPRLPLGRFLATHCPDVAIIDISDGLHNELGLLSRASDVGFRMYLDRLPVFAGVDRFCEKVNCNPRQFALFSGEEYELLFCTATPEAELRQQLLAEGIDIPVTCIGIVTEGNALDYRAGETSVQINDQTFSHFT